MHQAHSTACNKNHHRPPGNIAYQGRRIPKTSETPSSFIARRMFTSTLKKVGIPWNILVQEMRAGVGGGWVGGGVSRQTTRTREPRSFGERTGDETLGTRRKRGTGGCKGEGEVAVGQSKPGERKEGKGSSVAGSGDLARRPATEAGGELKRQYRRKLIIGVRCTREENKIQASSDCCFQLNPSCATLST